MNDTSSRSHAIFTITFTQVLKQHWSLWICVICFYPFNRLHIQRTYLVKLSVKSTLWTLQEGKRKCEPRNLIGIGQIFFYRSRKQELVFGVELFVQRA